MIDLEQIWPFITRLLFFATPIFYTIEKATQLYNLNLLNPLYYFISIARDIVVYTQLPDATLLIGACTYTLIALIIGSFTFKKLKYKFPDMI